MSLNHSKTKASLQEDSFLQNILKLEEITAQLCISHQQMKHQLELLQIIMDAINNEIQKFANK